MYSAYFLYPLAFTVLLVVFLLGHFKKGSCEKNCKVYILSDCYFYETFFFLYVN